MQYGPIVLHGVKPLCSLPIAEPLHTPLQLVKVDKWEPENFAFSVFYELTWPGYVCVSQLFGDNRQLMA